MPHGDEDDPDWYEQSGLGERMKMPNAENADWTQCLFCANLPMGEGRLVRGNVLACPAFPDGIPMDIINNKLDHRQPIEGDNGITFKPIEEEDEDRG